MSPWLRQKACWYSCIAVLHYERERAIQLQKYVGSPAGQQALLEPPPDTGRPRSGSGDIKEQSVSAHIYRQTDLWWNFKEIIYISPPLNWCMKFSSTMKHTKKYILSQINQPELFPSNWLWSTFSTLSCVCSCTYFTSYANSFSHMREDSMSDWLTELPLKGLP